MIRSERAELESGSLTTITLCRAERRNALTPAMITELVDALNEASERGSGVLLRGEGRVFCAGFDLRLCADSPDGSTLRLLLSGLSQACRAMRRNPAPVVVAAHGAAIAGGAALVAAADCAVGDRHGKYGYPVTRLGISPAVNVPFLAAAVGAGRARELSLLPDLISGERAARCGLVHRLAEDAEGVAAVAHQEAESLIRHPAGAFGATKAWLNVLDSSANEAAAARALEVSLGLTGGSEERAYLAAALGGEKA